MTLAWWRVQEVPVNAIQEHVLSRGHAIHVTMIVPRHSVVYLPTVG